MASQDNNGFMDNLVDAQKQAIDAIAENTKKFTNGNNFVNETVEKTNEWYKNWLENQKNFFTQTATEATTTTEKIKDTSSKMNEFYQNWFNMQAGWAKQMQELNTGWLKNTAANAGAGATANPMAAWTDWTNQMTNMWNGMGQTNAWTNQMQQWQNAFSMDAFKKSAENSTSIFNQYYEILNNNFAQWQKNFENGTVQDAYRNMVNVTDGYTRFYEMWAPLWKSIQEENFNMDMYKQYANPALYKDLMDKYFGFLPEGSRQYAQGFSDMMNNVFKQFGQTGINGYQQMRGMAGNFAPSPNEVFANMLSSYNNWYGAMNNAFAPLAKMMPANQQTKTLAEWNDIANRIMVYNIKNAELQYMIYTQGTDVMDKVAENIVDKIKKGEEISSIMALYQEWLNISDKTYVSLFESDEYGKLMAEVSALQMKLRKDIELQLEKYMVGIPVATRSEMDELYKTIYDLKKQVRELEKAQVRGLEKNLNTLSEDTLEEKTAKTKKKA